VDGARTVALPGSVLAAWSDASRGDLRPAGDGPDDGPALWDFAREASAASGDPVRSVRWLHQVHGPTVVDVPADPPAGLGTGPEAGDALVTDVPGVALCVLTADCGALALSSPEGVFAAVHAGWRGLLDGVVEAAVAAMRSRGATEVVGALGPCIHAGCYEFSHEDLDAVAAVYGDGVRGTTTDGRPALDVPAGIDAALARAGAGRVAGVDTCTACGHGYFSHRARRDTGRQALVVWAATATATATAADAVPVADTDPGTRA